MSPAALVDTSVAVALLVSDHQHHAATFEAVADRVLGLSGHAAFETFSVLSRLPPPARRTPRAVARMLTSNFPATEFLGAEQAASLLAEPAQQRISGGSVYDTLVGAAARHHGRPLITRDRRALVTYRALGVDVELIA